MHKPLPSATLAWQEPLVFYVSEAKDFAPVQVLVSEQRVIRFFDPTEQAVSELYDIAYPAEKDLPLTEKSHFDAFAARYTWPKGTFVFYPWDGVLVRFPSQDDLRALRTSRNRNLISSEEQRKLYGATILVAGLSVGSNIVDALAIMGIGGHYLLADMDSIDPTNLNRIRAPYYHVGAHKADALAMQLSQTDPYVRLTLLKNGLRRAGIAELLERHQPAIIIDEMDQLPLKVAIRQEAKARHIPVLSAADDGDSTLLDIERYDQYPNYPLFHGLIPPDVIARLLRPEPIERARLGALIGKYFVGSEHVPLRMFQSLEEVGKSLPSWPQLGGAAMQSGVAVAYAARQIILEQPLKHGRFVIGPDQVLAPEPDAAALAALEAHRGRLDAIQL